MADFKGTVLLLFILLASIAHVSHAQCTTERGSDDCSSPSSGPGSGFTVASTSARAESGSTTASAEASGEAGGSSSASGYSGATASSTGDSNQAFSSSSAFAGSSATATTTVPKEETSGPIDDDKEPVETVVIIAEPEPPKEDPPLTVVDFTPESSTPDPVAYEEPPPDYYTCGHHKPFSGLHASSDLETSSKKAVVPCIMPADPDPLPDAEPEPVNSTLISPPQPAPQYQIEESETTAGRVHAQIDARNVTGLAEVVIESDDVYGLNLGFLFEEGEREAEIARTNMRGQDKDVIAIKGLCSAGLDQHTKSKVVQLMVLTATSPDGYHFTQHRGLVEDFEEIFADDELLARVVEADPETYSRRRLLCAGCTPVNSYICAHCWPSSVCNAYYWCGAQKDPLRLDTEPTATSNADSIADLHNSVAETVAEQSGSTEGETLEETEDEDSESKKKKRKKRRNRRRNQSDKESQEDGLEEDEDSNKEPEEPPAEAPEELERDLLT